MSLVLFVSLLLSACGQSKEDSFSASTTVKIGILKNVTHAPGFIALQNNYFQDAFGENAKIDVTAFDNGATSQRQLPRTKLTSAT